MWNLADPPFECYFTEVIPLITFDDFRDFPSHHVFIFQAILSGPPSESFQSFQRPPLLTFEFSVTTDPPFCSPKN